MLFRILIILALAINIWESTALAEESMYVDDKLVLRVTKMPGEGDSVATIRSGDKVAITEQKNTYTKIITTKGLEGWVKSRYLVTGKPAIVKLKELAGVEKRIKVLTNENTQLKAANNRLTTKTEKNQQTIAILKKESDAQKQLLEKAGSSTEKNQNDEPLLKALIKENEALKQKIFSIQQLLGHSNLAANQTAANTASETAPAMPDFEFQLPVTFEDWKNLFDHGWLYVKSISPLLFGLFFLLILISFFFGRFLLEQRIRKQYSGVKIW